VTGTIHIVLAMKPMQSGFVENAQRHGVAGINVDGCRVGTVDSGNRAGGRRPSTHEGYQRPNATMFQDKSDWSMSKQGRWPANVIHDGSDEVVGLFPSPHGAGKARDANEGSHRGFHDGVTNFSAGALAMRFGDSGSAARFFKQVREK